ncbi:hypothetical protein AB0J21_05530 [Streptomyces sp. NPDC049954]|uniref:hypothetical protein n=1 Tax=Streptomyces sp. NPDC049954 TaxID=3155779 RepID=UPI003444EE5F
MSDFAGGTGTTRTGQGAADRTSPPFPSLDAVHESYSFACMRCGHGWERSYEIERHVDAEGHAYVVYRADGQRVPSPLTRPACLNCGGQVVRIMGAGRVSSASAQAHAPRTEAAAPSGAAAGERTVQPAHHWHLSDLLHPFQHHSQG